jgi:hypothetical protein
MWSPPVRRGNPRYVLSRESAAFGPHMAVSRSGIAIPVGHFGLKNVQTPEEVPSNDRSRANYVNPSWREEPNLSRTGRPADR